MRNRALSDLQPWHPDTGTLVPTQYRFTRYQFWSDYSCPIHLSAARMRVSLPATIAEQRATIVDLRAANVRLQERVRDLETRVGQHSGNSSRPPSSDLPGHCAKLTLGATCRMHGLDHFAYLAGVSIACMAGLAAPLLLPA